MKSEEHPVILTPLARPPVRVAYVALAWVCVALGAAGAVLPVMPTTPFLLVAAWAAGRGSEQLRRRLYAHPRFGPLLVDWQTEGSISRPVRWTAVIGLVASWVLLAARADDIVVPAATAIFFTLVAAFILTRPLPVSTTPAGEVRDR